MRNLNGIETPAPWWSGLLGYLRRRWGRAWRALRKGRGARRIVVRPIGQVYFDLNPRISIGTEALGKIEALAKWCAGDGDEECPQNWREQ